MTMLGGKWTPLSAPLSAVEVDGGAGREERNNVSKTRGKEMCVCVCVCVSA
jgi:hypothetical protein